MYHLLIVDDKEAFRRKIQRLPFFQERTEDVAIQYTARNGREALEILEQNGVDIVLTDIRMPVMDGLTLLRQIQERNLCRCTILLSEYTEFSYAKEGIIYGAFDYIVKPITNQNIEAVLNRAIAHLDHLSTGQDVLQKRISLLAGNILDGAREYRQIAALLQEDIEQEGASFPVQKAMAQRVLDDLCGLLLEARPYMERYVPTARICRLSSKLSSSEALFEALFEKIELLQTEINKFELASGSKLIQDICQSILLHVEEEISLQSIADKFFLNSKYLSTRFRQETGVRFMDFLTVVKMERAKVLLLAPDAKIYQIAERLGYADTEYFSKVFKNFTGVPPSSYTEK